MENKKAADQNIDNLVKDQINEDFKKDAFKTHWTWYLFLLSCVILVIGPVIGLILFHAVLNSDTNQDLHWKLSTIICNVLGLICVAIFAFFEFKNYKVQKFHTQFKWFKFILASLLVYTAVIIITCIILIIVPDNYSNSNMWAPITNIVISMVLTLVAVGLYRYGRFHIDKDIYMRRHGKEVKQEINAKQQHLDNVEKINKLSDEEFKKIKQGINDNDTTDLIGKEATSGISDKKFDEK